MPPTLREAQAEVIRSLHNFKESVQLCGDSVQYLNAEVRSLHACSYFLHAKSDCDVPVYQLSILGGKMKTLEQSATVVYQPFRECLFEYSAESKK